MGCSWLASSLKPSYSRASASAIEASQPAKGEPQVIVRLRAPRSTLSGIDGGVHCRASADSPVLRKLGGLFLSNNKKFC
jgi:hypothetical protein